MNVRQMDVRTTFGCAAMLFAVAVIAADKSGIPQHEGGMADQMGIGGPAETRGIESSVVLGSISLENDFPAPDDRLLRARVVTMLPGGTVQAHEYDSRSESQSSIGMIRTSR